MSTGPVFSNASILLICRFPELQYDTLLKQHGFGVVTAHSLEHGMSLWQPRAFDLVLIVVDGDLEASLEFCEGIKKVEPTQSIAFVTGWHTYVPPLSCPDDVIHEEYNPALFVKRVHELAKA